MHTPQTATTDRLHSNAFNFASFVQGGMDPRTGLYSLAINLPDVKANALTGPSLPLRLSYNPASRENLGFGEGWSLNLTRYAATIAGNFILSLHSGEAYRVTGSGSEPAMDERKLEHFHFYADGANQWRVVYHDGLVEYLQLFGDIAYPVRWEAPTGHGVNLNYGERDRLQSLTDDLGSEVLRITYNANLVTVNAYPANSLPAIFEMDLIAGEVREIRLPVEESARWAFSYQQRNGYRFVTQVRTPLGAWERLDYEDTGHPFPDNRDARLPRVTRHRVDPGRGQAEADTRYAYTANNFLGANSNISWADDGRDNLYKANPDYTYGSTASHYLAGAVKRVVERVYNSFHLLARERTTQGKSILEISTQYHVEPNKRFEDQPAYFQMPKREDRRWQNADGATRLEMRTTNYDRYGQLVEEVQANGVRTAITYYSAEGESEDCPADPYGFGRHLKSRTVHPAQPNAGAPELTTRYTYTALPVTTAARATGHCVLLRTETLVDNAEPDSALRTVTNEWLDQPDVPLQHGRLQQQTTQIGGFDTVQRFEYERKDSIWLPQSVLHATITLTGVADVTPLHDGEDPVSRKASHVTRVVNQEHSILTGQVLLERDDNDVEVRYQYDALQRVTQETFAPATEYEASRHYTYGLSAGEGGAAWQIEEDVQGVQLLTLADGLGRAVEQWRSEPGHGHHHANGRLTAPEGLQVFSAAYDALGQQTHETLFDNSAVGGALQAMTTTYDYDDWGQRCAEHGPDEVCRLQITDPVGNGQGPAITQWERSQDQTLSSAKRVTQLNLFEQPVTITRYLEQAGEAGSSTHYDELQCDYDGLGRKISESTAWRESSRRTTAFAYDAFDREVTRTLEGGSQVTRRYSPHSSEDLPIHIDLDGIVLGTQAFDGLDRMIRATTGGRLRSFTYEHSQTRPRLMVTPKNAQIAYTYQPRLGEAPIERRAEGQEQERYTYDNKTARLMACHMQDEQVLTRSYFTNGKPRQEDRRLDGIDYTMTYDYSVGERLLSYTDVNNEQQVHAYDPAGRLSRTVIGGDLSTDLEYDLLGRPKSIHTTDLTQGTTLTTRLAYDELGRETLRSFDYGDSVDTLEQAYDQADCIVRKTLRHEQTLLREERFEYDELGHLSSYTCEGPECPVDPYGNTVSSQVFICDALDNHLMVISTFSEAAARQAQDAYDRLREDKQILALLPGACLAEDTDIAEYRYDNHEDPAQLTSIVRNAPLTGYPREIKLCYDEDGNLLNDDAGRTLTYDALGRLVTVTGLEGETSSRYQYDPTDIISGRGEEGSNEHRFYRAGELATLVQGDHTTQIVRAGDHLVAERQSDTDEGRLRTSPTGGKGRKVDLKAPLPADAIADTADTTLRT